MKALWIIGGALVLIAVIVGLIVMLQKNAASEAAARITAEIGLTAAQAELAITKDKLAKAEKANAGFEASLAAAQARTEALSTEIEVYEKNVPVPSDCAVSLDLLERLQSN